LLAKDYGSSIRKAALRRLDLLIDECDPQNLLKLGFPDDEYDEEIQDIVEVKKS
jgi:hypothetical protein